jgi:predicted enzyme related to lactoylglutathione lyase
MTASARLSAVVLDCVEPASLAAFYRDLTGWDLDSGDGDFVTLDGGSVQLGFQRVDGYRPAGWPDPAKHAHLDFAVSDLAAATKEAVKLGATVPDFQPGEGKWTVLLDPEGHAFCLIS